MQPIPAIDRDAILAAVVWPRLPRPPEGQLKLIAALIGAMGAMRGEQPPLRLIADRLGVAHQSIYRTLRILEAKGIVVRMKPGIEIRLEANHE